MQASEIQSIFLSGTAKDCDVYRRELKDALQNGVPVIVHLQEDWAEAATLTVDVCKNKIVSQDGYIGLFGYRHGWQPWLPISEKSITHLEWEFALEHWSSSSPHPPIFIFLPSPGEEAHRELKRWADEVLEQDYPHSEAERQASLKRQENFLNEVRNWAKNRLINYYKTAQELREKGIASLNHWNRDIWKHAAQGRGRTRPLISEAELGAIGRNEQLQALARILSRLRQQQREVSAAFVVHGEKNHGQRQFANFLSEWTEWHEDDYIFRPSRPDRPEDPNHLARWVCELLGQPVTLADAMDILVATLADRLHEGNVVVLLEPLGKAPDRWVHFLAGFWKPLRQRLGQAIRQNPKGRFIFFVVDEQPCPTDQPLLFSPPPSHPPEAALALDTAQLIPLPELGPLHQNDIMNWLERKTPNLNGETIRYEQIEQISREVTQAGGMPVCVYERLQSYGLWRFPS
jgi:hypothetical protein